ncbi:hypothetical protein BDB00DRAFT_929216 [Zychaea mexicana]|uniref:uncharacterized protein n=1 Tax=Zychaea mexicana TaxID=64656 RepID=UPI0022FF08DD|nr:uncharacterized protein BDB00DRAFT_929216 [Zychaea mexicana]KAI9493154.1 hypothetical protein BDB00DRAFT_929216 [Zychaea mexicana]
MERLIKHFITRNPPEPHQHHPHHPTSRSYHRFNEQEEEEEERRGYGNNDSQEHRGRGQRRVSTIAARDQDPEESSEQEDTQSSTDEEMDFTMPRRRRWRHARRLGHRPHHQHHQYVVRTSGERRSGYPMSRYPYLHPHQYWMPTVPYTHQVGYSGVLINARAPLVPVTFAPPFLPSPPQHHQHPLHSPYWFGPSPPPLPINRSPPLRL